MKETAIFIDIFNKAFSSDGIHLEKSTEQSSLIGCNLIYQGKRCSFKTILFKTLCTELLDIYHIDSKEYNVVKSILFFTQKRKKKFQDKREMLFFEVPQINSLIQEVYKQNPSEELTPNRLFFEAVSLDIAIFKIVKVLESDFAIKKFPVELLNMEEIKNYKADNISNEVSKEEKGCLIYFSDNTIILV